MGAIFGKQQDPPDNSALEAELEAKRKEEEARAAELKKQQETYKRKVAKGVIGSRSLFGQAGGRGFFE
jgi:hypothetical protein